MRGLSSLESALAWLSRQALPSVPLEERAAARERAFQLLAKVESLLADPERPFGGAARGRLESVRRGILETLDRMQAADRFQLAPYLDGLEEGTLRPADLDRALLARPAETWDPFVEKLFGLESGRATGTRPRAGMRPHYPSPTWAIRRVATQITPDDVLFDVGSGLGKVAILVGWWTGAKVVGCELDGALVERARASAARLGLDRLRFLEQDAREVDYRDATAVYLYHPFEGAVLDRVLHRLGNATRGRAIELWSLGAIDQRLRREVWLEEVSMQRPLPGERDLPTGPSSSFAAFRSL